MKFKMSLLNPLSTTKPLSLKPFSNKTKASSEIEFLTLSLFYFVSASLAPLFFFLISSSGCSIYALASAHSPFGPVPD